MTIIAVFLFSKLTALVVVLSLAAAAAIFIFVFTTVVIGYLNGILG